MAEALYLHIGSPKAGSSYLQGLLVAHQEELALQGVFLGLDTRRAQIVAAASLRRQEWAVGQPWSWDLMAQEVRDRPGTAVISDELLCVTDSADIQRLVDSVAPTPVHVVLCARDIGRGLPSEWQQLVRGRGTTGYATWLTEVRDDPTHEFWERQHPVRVWERWSPHVEQGRFHLITLPPPGAPRHVLWRRFAGILGLSVPAADVNLVQNPSLGAVEAELLRRVNALLGDRFPMREPYKMVVRDHVLRPALLGTSEARPFGVLPEHADWIDERSRQIVAEVRSTPGLEVVGNPDELVDAGTVLPGGPDAVTTHELLEALIRAWGKGVDQERDRLVRIDQERAGRAPAQGGSS